MTAQLLGFVSRSRNIYVSAGARFGDDDRVLTCSCLKIAFECATTGGTWDGEEAELLQKSKPRGKGSSLELPLELPFCMY